MVHLGLYFFTSRNLSVHPQSFVKIYLGMTVLRILFFGVFIFMVIKIDPFGARQNAILFLLSYLLFTVLEVIVLFRKIDSKKRSKLDEKGL